ncbi:MAG: hypothetical protein PV362_17260 [Providencia heimbachae]|nr:hypothetical protein [Providencia heimbachae]
MRSHSATTSGGPSRRPASVEKSNFVIVVDDEKVEIEVGCESSSDEEMR